MKCELYNGDCAEIMRGIDDESIDLTVTSPPYDNLRDYKGFTFNIAPIASNLYRITKQGGVVVWIVNDAVVNGGETGTSFKQAQTFMESGFNLHDTMIWHKDSFSFPECNRYPQTFEYMFIFSKGKPKTFNPIKDRENKCFGMEIHGTYRQKDGTTTKRGVRWSDEMGIRERGIRHNVWETPSEKNNKTGHPAVFPQRLAEDHIRTWSNKGDVVLDPFLGSGTTGLAAIDLGREFIGVEISKEYFKMAKSRIEESMAQMRFDIC